MCGHDKWCGPRIWKRINILHMALGHGVDICSLNGRRNDKEMRILERKKCYCKMLLERLKKENILFIFKKMLCCLDKICEINTNK